MKHMKKLGSLLLVLIMAMALTVPAAAAVTFGNPPKSDHTYTLYKIFDAELDGTSLKNFTWNSGHFNKNAFIAEMAKLSSSSDPIEQQIGNQFRDLSNPTDNQVAEALDAARRISETVAGAKVAAALNAEGVQNSAPAIPLSTPVGPGYYMIIDTPPAGDGSPVYSLYNVVQSEGTINIKDKSTQETTTVSKLVQNAAGQWVYAADYEIGKEFRFQLSAPIKGFKADSDYNVVFHDMMNASQLAVPAKEDVSVSIRLANGTVIPVAEFDFDTQKHDNTVCEENCAFHIGFNVVAFKDQGVADGDMIVVEYPSTLLADAALGQTGNQNGVKLEFPGGTTPGNDVTVYTFNMVAGKVDGGNQNAPLPGAVFKLSRADGTEILTLGTPVYKNESGAPILDANGSLQYITGQNEDGTPILSTTGMTSFTFPTLAEGEYVLEETEAPVTASGTPYNPVGPYYFKVEPIYTKLNGVDSSLSELRVIPQPEKGGETLTATVDRLSETVNISTQVVNNTGFQMPETGGIGTTIFYIAGGVLVLGAVILLITKRRMHAEEE